MAQVNAGVAAWQSAVTNLGLVHHTSPDFNCGFYMTQLRWVTTIGGGFAQTTPDALTIEFALNDESGLPFNWNFSDDPPLNPPDLRAVTEHELGHAIGLKHPESNDAYPAKSWDGDTPTMISSMNPDLYAPGRTLQLDDIAGGYWMKSRQWVAYPEMGADAIPYWEAVNGTLTSCNASWACLWSGPSSAQYTFRFTVDGRDSRRTPSITVWWQRDSGATGTMQLELRTRSVPSKADGGPPGAWDVIPGPVCTAGTSSWATCLWNPTFPASQVRDIRLIIQNQTDGMIKIERVEANDG